MTKGKSSLVRQVESYVSDVVRAEEEAVRKRIEAKRTRKWIDNDVVGAVQKAFVLDYDNIPGQGPLMLFRVWEDGSKSLATPKNVTSFFSSFIDDALEARALVAQSKALEQYLGARRRELEAEAASAASLLEEIEKIERLLAGTFTTQSKPKTDRE